MKAKLITILTILNFSLSAWARLGDQESSIEHDRQSINGQQKGVQTRRSLKFYEMTAHSNRIREFVDANGRIFAVSWRGIADPDFSVLLGGYHDELRAALSNKKIRHGRMSAVIKTSNLTYQKSGHMRDLHGLIYLNNQLPANVKPGDLQ